MNEHMNLISELDVAIFHTENAMNMQQKLTHSRHPDAKLRVIVDQLKLARDVQLALLKRDQTLAELNSTRPAYYDAEGGSMCNGIGRSYF